MSIFSDLESFIKKDSGLMTADYGKLRCLSVVMPVYNEVLHLRQVFERVKSVPLPMEIILIDDNSTDGTKELLQWIVKNEEKISKTSKKNYSIKVIFKDKNQGKGAALRTGIERATGDVLIIQDADMEYDPSEYPRLLEPILNGEADVVYGSRFIGERRRVLLFWHSIGNRILTLFSNICTNLNLTDMETCYKVFKTEIIKDIPLRSNRFGFEPEITAKVAKLRCSIYEVPISYRGRSYAEGKKINWKDGIAAFWTIFKFWLIDDLYENTAGLRTLRIMEGAGSYNKWLFDQCSQYLGKRVLEVGSGVGNITKFLLSKEKVVATDIVDFYLGELGRTYQSHPNVDVHKLDLNNKSLAVEIQSKYHPDTILSMNVLEHIKDDKSALQNKNRILDIGGRLILLVPAHKLLFSAMDKNLGHFTRYNKKSLSKLLTENGFEIERSRYLNFIGAIGWFVNGRVLGRKILPSRQVRLFDFLVKLLSLEKLIYFPFGLSLLVVAKKVSEPE